MRCVRMVLAERKVLSLTKPKGKIYKTKSLDNYITPTEILNIMRCVRIVRIVSLSTCRYGPKSEINKPFVSETTESACFRLHLYLYMFCITVVIDITKLYNNNNNEVIHWDGARNWNFTILPCGICPKLNGPARRSCTKLYGILKYKQIT